MKTKHKAFCSVCKIATNHTVKRELVNEELAEYNIAGEIHKEIAAIFEFQIVQCMGCNSISFRHTEFYPGTKCERNSDTNAIIFTQDKFFETYYPERSPNFILEKRIPELPFLIRKIYKEIIKSYNSNLPILCASGLRALVAGVIAHFLIEYKSLKQGINSLSEQGLISKELAESLNIHRFLGNNALHKLEFPDQEDLRSSIILIELTLATLFDVPSRHQKLKESLIKKIS
jgi:hypothetical protein